MKCICCQKVLLKDDNDFINGGTTFNITCGYGSNHDGDVYEAMICDQCLRELDYIETVKFVEDYVYDVTPAEHRRIITQ